MTPVKDFIRGLGTGDPVRHDNLTMLPILDGNKAGGEPGYLLLEEAVSAKVARVQEMEAAAVHQVMFENLSERPVLMLGGEELAGARQNRIVNLTILAPPQSKIVIPVSCVEAGRWRPVTREFAPTPSLAFAKLRACSYRHVTSSMRAGRGRQTNQADVWGVVDAKLFGLGVFSATSAMREAFEERSADVESYVGALAWQDGQIGALFAIDGRPAGLDLFDHPQTCRKMMAKLARGYALDAVESRVRQAAENSGGGSPNAGVESGGADSVTTLRAWMDSIGEAEIFTRAAIGMGEDVRMESAAITGAALWVEDRYLHLCAFPIEKTPEPEERDPFQRPIWRTPRTFWY